MATILCGSRRCCQLLYYIKRYSQTGVTLPSTSLPNPLPPNDQRTATTCRDSGSEMVMDRPSRFLQSILLRSSYSHLLLSLLKFWSFKSCDRYVDRQSVKCGKSTSCHPTLIVIEIQDRCFLFTQICIRHFRIYKNIDTINQL